MITTKEVIVMAMEMADDFHIQVIAQAAMENGAVDSVTFTVEGDSDIRIGDVLHLDIHHVMSDE